MAATVVSNKPIRNVPDVVCEVKLSGLTAMLDETLTPSGAPSGVAPFKVEAVITAAPTDGSLLNLRWLSSDTSANTVDVEFDCPAGGSLDGATVTVFLHYLAHASGGIS